MDFKKTLKSRLYIAIIYIVLGIIIFAAFINRQDDNYISTFGFILTLLGIVRIRNYFLITKDDATIKKQQIIETDERNLTIISKAKSTAFSIYIILSCLSVIILSFLNLHDIAQLISYSVSLLVVLYWICYLIYQKKL
ncbi:MAG: hypothetical protein IKK43_03640 [Clostridia bacterium]|nr:hypothetical protein [Clostridia bacterium]